MKRWTFTYIMLLMIASCSYDAVVEMPDLGKEITFQAGVETKGIETRDYNLDYIDVKSYLISDSKAELFFDDKTFERIGDWFCSDPAYYWPSDKHLWFLLYEHCGIGGYVKHPYRQSHGTKGNGKCDATDVAHHSPVLCHHDPFVPFGSPLSRSCYLGVYHRSGIN